MIAQVLKKNREKIFIATKVGLRLNENQEKYVDGNPKYLKHAINASLERLGVDHIDLLYLHRIDSHVPIEESISAMAEFVKCGKVRYLGLSECTLEDLNKAHHIHPISAVQSEYSLLERSVERNGILKRTKEINAIFVPFAPLARGLFTNKNPLQHLSATDFRYDIPRYNGEHLLNNEKLAQELKAYAHKHFHASTSQLAIAWLIAQQDNIIPIPGTKKRVYLEDNMKALDIHLNSSHLSDLKKILEKYPNVGERYTASEQALLKEQ